MLFRRDTRARQGRGVVLYVKEGLDCTTLAVRDDVVKSLWVKTSGKSNKTDVVGVYLDCLASMVIPRYYSIRN